MNRHVEQLIMSFCWRLPRIVIYWCLIRGITHATTGIYSHTAATKITADEMLKRWKNNYRG